MPQSCRKTLHCTGLLEPSSLHLDRSALQGTANTQTALMLPLLYCCMCQGDRGFLLPCLLYPHTRNPLGMGWKHTQTSLQGRSTRADNQGTGLQIPSGS